MYAQIIDGVWVQDWDSAPCSVSYPDGFSVGFPDGVSDELYAEQNIFTVTITNIPRDAYHTYSLAKDVVDGKPVGSYAITDVSDTQWIALLTQAVQNQLDSVPRQRNYDGILSLASYATSSNTKFAAEGKAGVDWRDAVWSTCYTVMSEVKAGARAKPTESELLALLPAFVWPV